MRILFFICCFFGCIHAVSASDTQVIQGFTTEAAEQTYHKLITEIRCPKCQNQNLAGSNSVISKNMKFKIAELIKQGHDEAYIKNYMVERYSAFISYKAPVNKQTSILWILPPLCLLLVIFSWFYKTYRYNKAHPLNDDELLD